jgi:hypothetical protein
MNAAASFMRHGRNQSCAKARSRHASLPLRRARSLETKAVTEAVSGELADGRVQCAEMVAMAIAAERQNAKCGPTIPSSSRCFFEEFFFIAKVAIIDKKWRSSLAMFRQF